jgi:hypothetical protein
MVCPSGALCCGAAIVTPRLGFAKAAGKKRERRKMATVETPQGLKLKRSLSLTMLVF